MELRIIYALVFSSIGMINSCILWSSIKCPEKANCDAKHRNYKLIYINLASEPIRNGKFEHSFKTSEFVCLIWPQAHLTL